MKGFFKIIIVLFFGHSIGLEAQGTIDTININEIVISGNRVEVNRLNTPVTVSVISKEVIASQEESNILPVITRVTPGLFISEIGMAGYALGNGTSGQLSIRGVGGDSQIGSPNAQVLMLVDGQPQYMGLFGHPLPNFHMSSNVEKVEVIRGPASLLYGSNAMGGVINVITKSKVEDGLNLSASAAYGSFDTQKYSAGAGYKKNGFSAGFSLHHDQTDGHRDTSAFNITNLNAYANYEIDQQWKINSGFMIADYSFEDPGSAFNLSSKAFLGDISRKMATVSLLNRYEHTQGGIYAFYNWGTHSFSDGWESDDVNSGVNIYQAYNGWTGGMVTVGFDFKHYGGSGSLGFMSDTFLTVNETAAYIVVDQKIGNIININAGARYEHHSTFGGELVPQVGATVKTGAGMAVKGLVSKGFRSPTIMDLYLFAPNPNLGPERLINYELSWLQSIGSIGRVEITGYLINGSNLIIRQVNPNPGPPMIRANGGEFSNWGFEVESSFRLIQDLRLDANYSMLNSDTKRYFAPAHQFYLGGMYSISDFKLALNIKTISGLYTNIDSESPENDIQESYAHLNAKVIYQALEYLQLFISGKNLLNQEYQTVYGYTMPGINFMTGLSVQIR